MSSNFTSSLVKFVFILCGKYFLLELKFHVDNLVMYLRGSNHGWLEVELKEEDTAKNHVTILKAEQAPFTGMRDCQQCLWIMKV